MKYLAIALSTYIMNRYAQAADKNEEKVDLAKELLKLSITAATGSLVLHILSQRKTQKEKNSDERHHDVEVYEHLVH